MTDQQRDRGMGTGGSEAGPESELEFERDQSGLGTESPSGGSGWQGGSTSDNEPSSVTQAQTGSMGTGAGAGSMAGQQDTSWQGQTEGQDGGAMGQEGVMGGESWEGRARDTGQGGWTTGDSGASSEDETSADASAGAGETGWSRGSGEQTERS